MGWHLITRSSDGLKLRVGHGSDLERWLASSLAVGTKRADRVALGRALDQPCSSCGCGMVTLESAGSKRLAFRVALFDGFTDAIHEDREGRLAAHGVIVDLPRLTAGQRRGGQHHPFAVVVGDANFQADRA